MTILDDADARALIGTAESVDALVARSGLQRIIESDGSVDLEALTAADQRYRSLASLLLESTRVQLYGAAQPVTDWWWRVSELAGEAAPAGMVDVATAAAQKRVHPHTVRSAVKSGALPARKLGRAFLIQASDLARWQPRPVGRPGAGPRRESDELLAAFNAANTRRQWARAHELAKIIAENPLTARRSLAVALDAFNRGAAEEALQWVTNAIDRGLDARGRATAVITACAALTRLGRPRDALEAIDGAEAPDDLTTALAAARIDALIELGDFDEAKGEVDRLTASPVRPAEGLLLAARVDFHRGDVVPALVNAARYRDVEPNSSEGQMLFGSILGRLGDSLKEPRLYEQALTLFRKARKVEGIPAATKIGLCLARVGKWRRALWIARALHRLGQTEGSTAVLQAALLASEADGRATLIEAVDLGQRWLADHPVLTLHKAFLSGSQGEWLAASRLIDRVPVDPDGDPLELQVLRATALVAANRLGDAVGVLDRLSLAGTSLETVPELLRLALVVKGQEDQDQLELRDDLRALLRMIADNGGLSSILASIWLEYEEVRDRRSFALSPADIVDFTPGHSGRRVKDLGWDVYHRLNSTAVRNIGTVAA